MHLDDGIQKGLTIIQKWARQRNVLAHVFCFHENGIENPYHRERKTKHLLVHNWLKSESKGFGAMLSLSSKLTVGRGRRCHDDVPLKHTAGNNVEGMEEDCTYIS